MGKEIIKLDEKNCVVSADCEGRKETVIKLNEKNYTIPSKLSDDELYAKCQQYGTNAKGWLRRFAGLLPEVAKRRLYRRKGFLSIHEFANKLGGMSDYAVDRLLNLHAKLQDKPALLKQLESGEHGWSKIAKVAYVATPETDREWAEKVEKLPQHTLEVVVKNYREKSVLENEAKNNSEIPQLPITEISEKDVEVFQPYIRFSFPVSQKVDFELRLLKQRLEKIKKGCLSWNQVFEAVASGEMMPCPKCAKQKYANRKVVIRLCPDCARKRILMAKGRAVPEAIKQYVKAKYGDKCAFPLCNKPAVILHHTKRFSLQKNHDPDFIVPLCKEHHDLAHAGLIANEEEPPEKWVLRDMAEKGTLAAAVDKKMMEHKYVKKQVLAIVVDKKAGK